MLSFSLPPVGGNPFFAGGMEWFAAWKRAAQLSGGVEVAHWNGRQLRQDWFAGLSEMTDSYLRSPLFLQWMQSYLKAITQPPAPPGVEPK